MISKNILELAESIEEKDIDFCDGFFKYCDANKVEFGKVVGLINNELGLTGYSEVTAIYFKKYSEQMEKEKMNLHEKVTEAMLKLGLKERELSKLLGHSENYLGRALKGEMKSMHKAVIEKLDVFIKQKDVEFSPEINYIDEKLK